MLIEQEYDGHLSSKEPTTSIGSYNLTYYSFQEFFVFILHQ
ncbi:hypothetical protein SEUBUCD646_0B00120 [Saccharomyces eubayanus]|uniref:Uncharacterized protein n=1 Tax=Saccharomyces eubayanus TaxID=1080349 RepID=A0ABN8VP58_SACEU|nr:hypothetical protein SEUBUCD650_0P00120 [Saccharomyces eubayanus]CAI1835297.1 hypothetical protein SEUBUCD646_0B00120 [Saccharomyces eubayanus]